MDRRDWLKVAASAMAWPIVAGAEDGDDASAVEAKGRSVGLGGFGRAESPHYVAVGNAPEAFRDEVVTACESLAAEFLKHFKAKGFAVAMPPGRMTVVVLADAESYAKFAGETGGLAVGGHYEPGTNRLVVFDFRADQGQLAADAKRINSFTLGHEANHQLDFNTGLLDRAGDVPAAVSEGLGTYSETWLRKEPDRIGLVNRPRLGGFGKTSPWIPLSRLLVEDDLFDAESTRNDAYAEAWALVHSHMKDPGDRERLPRFRAYLQAIRGRRDAKHRLDDAREHLGDLGKLDAYLRRYVKSPKGR